MRYAFVLCVFIILTNVVNAQDWTKGGKWYHTTSNQIGPYVEYGTTTTSYLKDTIVNGIPCSKFAFGCGCISGSNYLYKANNQVFWFNLYNNQFQLLYDFNKLAGDSFVVHILQDSITIIIDSVKYENINGKSIKAQYIHHGVNSNYSFGNIMYEGIGASDCLLPSYGACDNYPAGVKCYEDSVNGLYKFSSEACDTSYTIFTSVYDKPFSQSLKIYPTVTSDELKIESDSEITNLSIVDLFGRQLLNKAYLRYKEMNLSLGDFETGIYFINVVIDGKTLTRKIIKVHQ